MVIIDSGLLKVKRKNRHRLWNSNLPNPKMKRAKKDKKIRQTKLLFRVDYVALII